jgi:hypothetical protein
MYEQEKEATDTGVRFTTTSSMEDVKRSLFNYVITEDDFSIMMHKLVVADNTDEQIIYIHGNKLVESFKAVLSFATNGDVLESEFVFVNWNTHDGVSTFADKMLDLRQSVIEAFKHADPRMEIDCFDIQHTERNKKWGEL